jgi:Ca2+-binding RTX toxin-like protein
MSSFVFDKPVNMLSFNPTQFTVGTISWDSATKVVITDLNGLTATISGTGFVSGEPKGTITGAILRNGAQVVMTAAGLDLSLTQLSADRSNEAALKSLLFGGNVSISGSTGGDVLVGGVGGAGNDTLNGRAGADTLYGEGALNYLDGGAGADKLIGKTGVSFASYADATAAVTVNLLDPTKNKGDAAGDTYTNIHGVVGSKFNDVIVADNHGDTIKDGDGNDTITGGSGGDTITVGNGRDVITGGSGKNVITAGNGADKITVGSGANTIVVGNGNDVIVVGAGKDAVHLGSGADTVTLGGGADLIVGSLTGHGTFVFNATSDSKPATPVTIENWHSGDKINLSSIDANTTLAGIQHFAIGTDTKAPGTIVITHNGAANTLVALYTNASGVAASHILLGGDQALTASDFILTSPPSGQSSRFAAAMAGFAPGPSGQSTHSVDTPHGLLSAMAASGAHSTIAHSS